MTYLRSFTAAGESAAATVVVFPQAGAGCLRLRATAAVLPRGTHLLGVQLPGREDRVADPVATSLAEVVDRVSGELREPARRRPLVLLGVSLGALIAYEVARRLESTGTAARSLVVAAARSPEHWRTFPAANPPRAHLTALLHPSVRESGLAGYAVASLRSDLRLMADYQVPSAPLTGTSLRSVSGRRDTVVTTAQMARWRESAADYRGHQVIEADHHEFMDPDALIGMISDAVPGAAFHQAVRG
ncbi:thioesterase [Streptomyces sp. TRM S81-3]|uniref:Thioesterase n=1 Tax=Streptomyces griseicoloratus TaxID=2752516 RepID=A0A926QT26_9ACTN|nr:alpha/beta fold hydrolase [Streptomyces griseicoloratus]MBD0422888.1 thioesterase [Streptomyces griseicoloratus]